jgi:glyoxylase-like metal-dependent hydrolase (beta-lactamase superfamily II)
MRMFSRRQALFAGAALPLAATLPALPARAGAEMMGAGFAPFHRFRLGGFEVTALLAGTNTVPEPNKIFGLNASAEEFAEVSEAAFLPTDRAQFFFTPTVVNTGSELVLFDTGLAPEGITAALAAAGYAPEQVDVVVLTHMHPDHIGGLMAGGAPTFTNARYVTGSAEHNHWMGAGSEQFDANVRPMTEKMTFLDDGGTVGSGITAMLAAGHTPGHMIYMLESEGQRLALTADTANHYVWSLAHPDWEVRFDADKAAAAATRREVSGCWRRTACPSSAITCPFPRWAMSKPPATGSAMCRRVIR